MAFGRGDTDQLYERTIVPVLRKLRITPVRVDRIEHNDDIDKRIIQEIERADFAIADLTYARPSVYFEAGYAQRMIPVIYTGRSDHLHPRSDDPEGNLRVHFDLQMKNIIKWAQGSEEAFSERLRRRVKSITAPLIEKQKKSLQNRKQEEEFAALSVGEKLNKVVTIGAQLLMRHGFHFERSFWMYTYSREGREYRERRQVLPEENVWFGTRVIGKMIQSSLVVVTPSLTKSATNMIQNRILSYPQYNISPKAVRGQIEHIRDYVLLVSLRRNSIDILANYLPTYKYIAEANSLFREQKQALPLKRHLMSGEVYFTRGGTAYEVDGGPYDGYYNFDPSSGAAKRIPREITIHLLGGVRSEAEFRERLHNLLEE